MRLLTIAAVFGAVSFAAPAMAWNETQPASNDMAVWAYPSKANYCPAGLQPVVVGGVVCCGTPTHYGYQSHPAPKPRKVHKPAKPVVQYSKSYSETVVYEKGQ